MSAIEMITLTIALAALVTSCVSAYEMVRQSKNAVRPAIVVLEKDTKAGRKEEGRSLYLCNMGNSMAMNVNILDKEYEKVACSAGECGPGKFNLELPYRTEIAVGRRALLAEHYTDKIIDKIKMEIHYVDVNGTRYYTEFDGSKYDEKTKGDPHNFGRKRRFLSILGFRFR